MAITLEQAKSLATDALGEGSSVDEQSDRFRVYAPYGHPLRFKDLNKLSDLFGTDEINLERGEHHPGYSYSSWTYEDSYDDPPYIDVFKPGHHNDRM